MRKKELLQKVLGVTITAVLLGNSCVGPILAEEMVMEEVTEELSEDVNDTLSQADDEVLEEEIVSDAADIADDEEEIVLDMSDDSEEESLDMQPEYEAFPEVSASAIAPITITKQLENVTAKKGDSVTFAVEAEGTGLTYQWKYRKSETGDWLNFTTSTRASVKKKIGDWDGWQVKCIITDASGSSVESEISTISLETEAGIKITKQLENVEAKKGDSVTFAVEAEGTGLTYQWKYRKSETGDWLNFTTSTRASVKKTIGDWNGWQVKCIITDASGNSVESEISTISLETEEAIKITKQLENVTAKKGDSITFAVEAEGTGLVYQWKYRKSETGDWLNFTTSTRASVKKTIGDWDGWQVKCIITDASGNSVESDISTISLEKEITIKITKQPQSVETKRGTYTVFEVEAEGTELVYQWMYRKTATSAWRNFNDGTTPSIKKFVGDWDGWQVKCVITDASGNSIESDIVDVTIQKETGIKITKQLENITAKKGDSVTFAVEAEGTGLSYQWKYRKSAEGAWLNFTTANKPSVKKTIGDWDGWQVKCIITDASGNSVESEISTVLLEKETEITITKQLENIIAKKGDSVTFAVEAEGTDLSYQWKYRKSAEGAWLNFTTANKPSVKKTIGDWDGWQVKCIITDASGNSVESEISTISLEKALEITKQPVSATVKLNGKAEFSIVVNKEDVTYQWETHGAYQTEFVSVKGATESTYHVNADTKNKGQVYRCVITDKDGVTVTSDEAVLNIQYQNSTATFVNAGTKEIIEVAEAEKFEATAGLPAGNIIKLPKSVKEKASQPYAYYTMNNGSQIPVNLEAVVEGSSASFSSLELFFYVTDDVVVYVTV